MKRSLTIVVLALLVLGAVAQGEELGPCLLRDGQFAELDDEGKPASWNLHFWNTNAQLTVDESISYFGTRSVRIECSANDRGSVIQVVRLPEGKTYELSIWYRTESRLAPDSVMARMYIDRKPAIPWEWSWLHDIDVNDYEITSSGNLQCYGSNHTQSEWEELKIRFSLPAGTAPSELNGILPVRVEIFNRFGNGTLWVGGMSLREVL